METIAYLSYGSIITFIAIIILSFIIPEPAKEELEQEWEKEASENGFKNWNV